LSVNLGPASGVSALDEIPSTQSMNRLSMRIDDTFRRHVEHRMQSGVDAMLLKSMLMARAQYSADEISRFKLDKLPSDIFTPLCQTKIRAATSQLVEIFNSPSDKPWTMKASPVADVPDFVAEEQLKAIMMAFLAKVQLEGRIPDETEAQIFGNDQMGIVLEHEKQWADVRAARMEKQIHDYMVQGGWVQAFSEYANYIAYYGTGIIKGPIPRTMKRKTHELSQKTRTWKYTLADREVLCYEAVNPWDCYPAPGAKNVNDGPLCIKVRFNVHDLWQFAAHKAKDANDKGRWFKDTVKALLARYPKGGVKLENDGFELTRAYLENDGANDVEKCQMEGIEFFGEVRGSDLLDLGIRKNDDNSPIEEETYYEVHAISIAGYVVYCKVINMCIGRPISKGVFYEVPDSWWGDSIAMRCESAQRVMNSALRNLVNNMAMASGPGVVVKDIERLADKGPNALKIRPWKVWPLNPGAMGQTDIPIVPLEFSSHVAELINLFQAMKQQADDDSGIPAYTYGNNSNMTGALRTSSGLAQMMESTNRVMKMVVMVTDREVIRHAVQLTFDYEMVYGKNMAIKGDCEINPSGTMGKILQEKKRSFILQVINILPQILQIRQQDPELGNLMLRILFEEADIPNADKYTLSDEEVSNIKLLQRVNMIAQAAMGRMTAEQASMDAQMQPEIGGSPRMAQIANGIEQNPGDAAMNGGMPPAPGSVAERRSAA
jgi:hypothetical protein